MNGWMHLVGWVLVHFIWEGMALALAAAVVLHLCRRRSPSVRYAIACGTMAAMLLAVVWTAGVIETAAVGVQSTHVSPRAAADGRRDVLLPITVNEAPSRLAVSSTQRIERLLPWIVSTWLLGVTLLLARAGASWWRVRRLHQIGLSAMGSRWQPAANRIASRLGLTRIIRIIELPSIDVPLVVGCLRPIVVLPIAAMSNLNAAQVESILAHELAHVRRHDYCVNLMQTMAEAVLFYHPAVWWLSERIRDEREHCCDDIAVAVCGDPVGYAAALTELETLRSDLTLAAAASGGSLLNRVRRLLRAELVDDSRTSSWTLALLVAAIVGVLTLHVVAQTSATADENPKFEVASVRRNTSGDNKMTSQILPGGRYNAINIPPRLLIINSYRLQEQQLVGAPAWISSERFDIVAKAEGELGPPVGRDRPSRLQLMIRGLLEERFKLKVHRESRELPIYALVLARPDGKLGPELKVATTDCDAYRAARRKGGAPPEPPKQEERPQCGARVMFGELAAGGQPLLELVSMLSAAVGRSVVDRTGLRGNYDIYLKWTPDQLPARAAGTPATQPVRVNGVEIGPNGPSIFTALQEQLGLKLVSERGTVEALVIDHIERPAPD